MPTQVGTCLTFDLCSVTDDGIFRTAKTRRPIHNNGFLSCIPVAVCAVTRPALVVLLASLLSAGPQHHSGAQCDVRTENCVHRSHRRDVFSAAVPLFLRRILFIRRDIVQQRKLISQYLSRCNYNVLQRPALFLQPNKFHINREYKYIRQKRNIKALYLNTSTLLATNRHKR